MPELKHTPGPWEAHKIPNRNWSEVHYNKAGECVAEIVHNEVDAKLISAAPEMIAALDQICKFLEFKNPLGMNVRSMDYMIWEMCQPAIKKATT